MQIGSNNPHEFRKGGMFSSKGLLSSLHGFVYRNNVSYQVCGMLKIPWCMQRVHKRVIDALLKPRQWAAPQDRRFFLSAEEISELCEDAEKIFKDEPTVLELDGMTAAFRIISSYALL